MEVVATSSISNRHHQQTNTQLTTNIAINYNGTAQQFALNPVGTALPSR